MLAVHGLPGTMPTRLSGAFYLFSSLATNVKVMSAAQGRGMEDGVSFLLNGQRLVLVPFLIGDWGVVFHSDNRNMLDSGALGSPKKVLDVR